MQKILKYLSINFGVLFIFLLLLEILANIIEPKIKKGFQSKYPEWELVFNAAVGYTHNKNGDSLFYKNNPNISNSISISDLYSHKIYGNEESKSNFIISTLGGSTTDPYGNKFSGSNGTWPDHLGKLLEEIKPLEKIEVINYGIGGANSSGELYRLISNFVKHKSDVVISLNGLNEIYFSELKEYNNPDNIYAPKMLIQTTNGPVLPLKNKTLYECKYFCLRSTKVWKIARIFKKYYKKNNKFITTNNFRKNTIDLNDETIKRLDKTSDIWFKNIQYMNNISLINNSNYYVFIQPVFGYQKTREEMVKLIENLKTEEKYKKILIDYLVTDRLEKNNYLFKKLDKYCLKLNYCFNAATALPDLNIYGEFYTNDLGHLNSKGNLKLAEYILSKIK